MADGLNQVTLLGNLGADPELRMTGSGQAVLSMRLATSRGYLDRNQNRQERTEWHSVSVWGKRAEALARFLTKGARLAIVGELRYSEYSDRTTGERKWRTDIVARDVILCGNGSGKRDDAPSRGGQQRNEPRDADDGAGYGYPDSDDDIPF